MAWSDTQNSRLREGGMEVVFALLVLITDGMSYPLSESTVVVRMFVSSTTSSAGCSKDSELPEMIWRGFETCTHREGGREWILSHDD